MCTIEMPRSDKEFRLDDRILDALKRVKDKTGMSVNSYVESLLFHHLKGVGEIPIDTEPLPEARGGKRPGAGKPPKAQGHTAGIDPKAEPSADKRAGKSAGAGRPKANPDDVAADRAGDARSGGVE
jgi:hypothetical protein